MILLIYEVSNLELDLLINKKKKKEEEEVG
jgi:hypothetical protein